MCVYTYTHIHGWTNHIYIYIYIYTHTHTYIYIYIYIYTYIRTYMHGLTSTWLNRKWLNWKQNWKLNKLDARRWRYYLRMCICTCVCMCVYVILNFHVRKNYNLVHASNLRTNYVMPHFYACIWLIHTHTHIWIYVYVYMIHIYTTPYIPQ